MYDKPTDISIFPSANLTCQELEAPEIKSDVSVSPPDVPEFQVSTMQVPFGAFSIFDLSCHDLSGFDMSVYMVVNWRSNWDTGVSHALSYREIANHLGVRHRSQVGRSLKRLIACGFLKKLSKRQSDGATVYQVIHHKCDPADVPLDKEGRPLKCAVPIGSGSPMDLMKSGKLSWRLMLQWITQKVQASDWVSGIASMVRREFSKLIRFSMQTVCNNYKKLCNLGLMKRLSKPHEASTYQLYPKPYAERRERAEYKGKRPLPLIEDRYYSYNKRWRFHKDTLQLQMLDVGGRWRDASMNELLTINPKIHCDFRDYMDASAAPMMEAIRQLQASLSDT